MVKYHEIMWYCYTPPRTPAAFRTYLLRFCGQNHTHTSNSCLFFTPNQHSFTLARLQIVTCSFQTGVGKQQPPYVTVPSPSHLSPVIYFICLCFTATGPRSETNLCVQERWRGGSDSTSFSPSLSLHGGGKKKTDGNIWNTIVPPHSHIWSTIAPLATDLQKHSSGLKSLLAVPRPSLFSQHGINVLIWGSGFNNAWTRMGAGWASCGGRARTCLSVRSRLTAIS